MKEVLDNMKQQISLESDPFAKIERFALVHLKLIEDNKDMAEIIQVELRQSDKFMKHYHNEKFAQYLDLIGNIIQEGKERGELRGFAPIGVLDQWSIGVMVLRV